MFQAAAALSGGVALRQKFQELPLPTLQKPGEGPQTFKLTVRVLGAAIPGLSGPGAISCERPYLKLSLGDSQKETEFAEHEVGVPIREVGAVAKECPWRFSDSLTFRCRVDEVMGPGLKVEMYLRKDVVLWPAKFQMRPFQVAEGLLDLKSRVLPACERRLDGSPSMDLGTRQFVSPMVLVGMSHVKGGTLGDSVALGEVVAHVAMVFSMDVDPEEVFIAAGWRPGRMAQKVSDTVEATKNRAHQTLADAQNNAAATTMYLGTTLDQKVTSFTRWLDQPSSIQSAANNLGPILPLQALPWAKTASNIAPGSPINAEAAKRRAEMRAWAIEQSERSVPDPDLDPDGWVSHRGPDGRQFWHHLSMGPAPWQSGSTPLGSSQRVLELSAGCSPSPSSVATPSTKAGSPSLTSPDESPEGWVSYTREDGRQFWHHEALGPAPWSSPTWRSKINLKQDLEAQAQA